MPSSQSVRTSAVAPSAAPSTSTSVDTELAVFHTESIPPSTTGAGPASTASVYDTGSTSVSVPTAPGWFHPCVTTPSVTCTSKSTSWPSVAPGNGSSTTAAQPVAVWTTSAGVSPVPSRRTVCVAPSRRNVMASAASTVASATSTYAVRESVPHRSWNAVSPSIVCNGSHSHSGDAVFRSVSDLNTNADRCGGGSSPSTAPW